MSPSIGATSHLFRWLRINGNAAIVEALLKHGADPTHLRLRGNRVDDVCSAERRTSVKLLLAHGASVNAKEGWHGQTALMRAAAESSGPLSARSLEREADVRALEGRTHPLLFAVRAGDIRRFALLGGGATSATLPDGVCPRDGVLSPFRAGVGHCSTAASQMRPIPAAPRCMRCCSSAIPAIGLPSPIPSGVSAASGPAALVAHDASLNARIDWKGDRFDRDDGVVKGPISIGRNFQVSSAPPFWLAARAGDVAAMRVLGRRGPAAGDCPERDAAHGGRGTGVLGRRAPAPSRKPSGRQADHRSSATTSTPSPPHFRRAAARSRRHEPSLPTRRIWPVQSGTCAGAAPRSTHRAPWRQLHRQLPGREGGDARRAEQRRIYAARRG